VCTWALAHGYRAQVPGSSIWFESLKRARPSATKAKRPSCPAHIDGRQIRVRWCEYKDAAAPQRQIDAFDVNSLALRRRRGRIPAHSTEKFDFSAPADRRKDTRRDLIRIKRRRRLPA